MKQTPEPTAAAPRNTRERQNPRIPPSKCPSVWGVIRSMSSPKAAARRAATPREFPVDVKQYIIINTRI
ncbi:MAG: hypothetical protein GX897_05575 [Clostridiales bacterium]|nr:hypothetical protein [Clostridiales bacterium]